MIIGLFFSTLYLYLILGFSCFLLRDNPIFISSFFDMIIIQKLVFCSEKMSFLGTSYPFTHGYFGEKTLSNIENIASIFFDNSVVRNIFEKIGYAIISFFMHIFFIIPPFLKLPSFTINIFKSWEWIIFKYHGFNSKSNQQDQGKT